MSIFGRTSEIGIMKSRVMLHLILLVVTCAILGIVITISVGEDSFVAIVEKAIHGFFGGRW